MLVWRVVKGLPSETRKLAAFLRRMWSDLASLPGPTRSPAANEKVNDFSLILLPTFAVFLKLGKHGADQPGGFNFPFRNLRVSEGVENLLR